MNLESRKISFIQEFLCVTNEDIVVGLEEMLRAKKAELLKQGVNKMSTKQFNAEIDQALEDSKKGRLVKAADLKAKIERWD